VSYTDETKLKAALGTDVLTKISDRDKDGAINSGVVTAAIRWADSRIDTFCNNRYSVPFTADNITAAPAIRYISEDLAKWRLLTTSMQARSFSEQLYEDWKTDFKNAMDTLKEWRDGESEIPGLSATGMDAIMSVGRAGDDVEQEFTETVHEVGGDDIDTGEAGSMDTW
jgi:phage gp36-like protein